MLQEYPLITVYDVVHVGRVRYTYHYDVKCPKQHMPLSTKLSTTFRNARCRSDTALAQ